MGKVFYDSWAPARRCFQTADEICEAPISRTCFEGPHEQLTRTEIAQPAIFTVSYVCMAYALERGLEPSVVSGHSLGEYSALAAARVIDFETGVELVSRRARLMAEAAGAGDGMAAVIGLAVEEVRAVVDSIAGVVLANVNCPGQVVLSGAKKGLARVEAPLKDAGARRVVPLAVSGAFHSKAMERANKELAPSLEAAIGRDPVIPIVQNASGKAARKASVVLSNLKRQMTSPVLWEQCVSCMDAMRVDSYVELGPGGVLKGLVERCLRGSHVWSVDEPEGVYEVEEMMMDA